MKKLISIAALVVIAVGVYAAVSTSQATSQRRPVAPTTPAVGGVHGIVVAQPFVLDTAWKHVWRAEAPTFDAGWLLVLEVDPAFVVPRQMEEPVLYAGTETVERVNHGQESARVIAILPSRRTERGGVALDLASTPFYFGTPDLPERVNAAQAERELSLASARGVRPLPVPKVLELLHLASRDELDQRAGLLVLEHSPEERDTGTGLLAPRPK